MSSKSLRQLVLSIVLAGATWQAAAEVKLRVEARPLFQPIDAYVLATDGAAPLTGLTAADFSVRLDGSPVDDFEFALPPREDPAQRVSIVIVAQASLFSSPADHSALIDELEPGDFVSVVRFWGDIEYARYGGVSTLPFTQIDNDEGSRAIADFLEGLAPRARGTPMYAYDGFMRGLREFAAPAVSLPDGPKALVTLQGHGGSRSHSLSDVVRAANDLSVPIFNVGYAGWNPYRDVVAESKALAATTGGVRVPLPRRAGTEQALATMASWLKNGYRVTLAHDVATDCKPHVLMIAVRGEAASHRFVRCDTTPEPFTFTWLRDVAVDTVVVSEPALITGIDTSVPVRVLDGEYSIGCSTAYTSKPGRIRPGESVCVRHTTAARGGLEAATLLLVGGETAWFLSSTLFR